MLPHYRAKQFEHINRHWQLALAIYLALAKLHLILFLLMKLSKKKKNIITFLNMTIKIFRTWLKLHTEIIRQTSDKTLAYICGIRTTIILKQSITSHSQTVYAFLAPQCFGKMDLNVLLFYFSIFLNELAESVF